MTWTVAPEADCFVLCLFKRSEIDMAGGLNFTNAFEKSIRSKGGRIPLKSDNPQKWEVLEGKDQFIEANHLQPAIFDFNSVIIGAMRTAEDIQSWWTSDEVFELLKRKDAILKMGVFIVDGLLKGVDTVARHQFAFGDKIVLLELSKVMSFKPLQLYADNYKRFAANAIKEIGVPCRLLFAEGAQGVLMNDFPLEVTCASTWRSKADAHLWFAATYYQEVLAPPRMDFSRSLTIIIPMFEDNLIDWSDGTPRKRKPVTTTSSKLRPLALAN